MTLRQDLTGDERSADIALADTFGHCDPCHGNCARCVKARQRGPVEDGVPASFRDHAEFWLIVGLALCALGLAVAFALGWLP